MQHGKKSAHTALSKKKFAAALRAASKKLKTIVQKDK